MNANFSTYASRPVSVGYAVRIAFCILAGGLALCVGKAVLINGLTTSAMAQPVATQMATVIEEPKPTTCRNVAVEIDEGYGVRGRIIRWVCSKAQ